MTDLSVAFADAHIFRQLDLDDRPALLLGMNAMKAFDRISIDFAAKKVRFVLPGTSMRSSRQGGERRQASPLQAAIMKKARARDARPGFFMPYVA